MNYNKLMKLTFKQLIELSKDYNINGAAYPSKGHLASAIRVKMERLNK